MPLLRNNAVVADSWFHAGLDDPLPVEDDVFVPFGRLLREFEALSKRNGRPVAAKGGRSKPGELNRIDASTGNCRQSR